MKIDKSIIKELSDYLEEFRHKSLISDIATGGIFGLGVEGYILAIISIEKILKNENR